MADIVCVEPGVDHERSVVEVNGSDTLVFPHVDSCMSVTMFVPSSTLIGGHAGMMDTTTFEMNASGLLDAMIQRIADHMQQRLEQAIDDSLVELGGLTPGDELHFLAELV